MADKDKQEQPKPRSTQEVQLNKEALEADKAKQEEAGKAAREKFSGAFAKVLTGDDKGTLDMVFNTAMGKLLEDWEARRKDLYVRAQKGEKITCYDLEKATSEIERQMQDSAGIITVYILEMAKKSPKGELSGEALAAAIYSSTQKASEIAKIAIKQKEAPEIVKALKFALSLPEIDEKTKKEKKIDQGEVFETLSNILKPEPPKPNQPFQTPHILSKYAWTALSFMNVNLQKEFGKFYIEKNKISPQDAQNFLDKWSKEGSISIDTMREILKDAKIDPTKEFEQKAQEYSNNWKIKNDFTQKAKLMITTPYGSKNEAMEKLSLSGILDFATDVWSWGTIGMNLATTAFYGGRLNDLKDILSQLPKNPWFMAAVGIVGAKAAMKQTGGSLSEAFKTPAEREVENKKAAKEKFKSLASNLKIRTFFESGGFMGAKKYYDYLQDVRKESKDKEHPFTSGTITKKAFIDWLKKDITKAKPEEKTGITEVIKTLENFDENAIPDKQFFELAIPADTLGIGGTTVKQAGKNYQEAIEAIKTK